MPLLEVRDFSYTYPGEQHAALDSVDLSIDQHAFVVITGESGCGKSTLGKALAGFLFQDDEPNYSGSITVNNTNMAAVPLFSASERVAYVQQNPEDQFCTLTVQDEIAFGLENRCMAPEAIRERIKQVLEVVQGSHLIDRNLATLSGGEKQKIAIASMLALSPDILILDEPTSNLDPQATENIFAALHQLREQQALTIIIIEHKLSQLMPFSPELYVMENGKLNNCDSITNYQTKLESASGNGILIERDALSSNWKDPLVTLKNLSLVVDQKKILDGITFHLFPGEFVSLMGANGSGKTSLLMTIMGFFPQAAGKRTAFGKDLSTVKISTLVEEVGFVFQNPDHQLFTPTVWDEIQLLARNLNRVTPLLQEEMNTALESSGLGSRKQDHPQRLSYGEKRRLNVLSVIQHQPKLLLIDELLIGQDDDNGRAWMIWLKKFTQTGGTVLLVNHHATFTQQYCDRVIFLNEGSVLTDSNPQQAFNTLRDAGLTAFLPLEQGWRQYV